MMCAVRGPRVAEAPKVATVTCRNCGHEVEVKPDDERAYCRRCSNVWNWKTKQLIRGQR